MAEPERANCPGDHPPDLQRLIEDALCSGGEEQFAVHVTHPHQVKQVVAGVVGPLLAAKTCWRCGRGTSDD